MSLIRLTDQKRPLEYQMLTRAWHDSLLPLVKVTTGVVLVGSDRLIRSKATV